MTIDISKIINDKLAEMDADGSIEAYISEQTEKTVKDAIKESFGSYRLKNAIEDKIVENFPEIVKDIGLAAYNTHLAETVRKLIISGMEEDAGTKIVEAVNSILCQKVDKITLSELLKKWRAHIDLDDEDVKRDHNEDDDGFTCALKERRKYSDSHFKYYSIFLDEEGNKEFDDLEDFDIVIRLEGCWWGDREKSTTIEDIYFRGARLTKEFIHHTPDRFEQFLLNLYLNKTPIILDVENYDEDDHYYSVENY